MIQIGIELAITREDRVAAYLAAAGDRHEKMAAACTSPRLAALQAQLAERQAKMAACTSPQVEALIEIERPRIERMLHVETLPKAPPVAPINLGGAR